MQYKGLGFFTRRDTTNRSLIVGQLLYQCKCFVENMLDVPSLQSVAAASLVIFEQLREVARKILHDGRPLPVLCPIYAAV